ncbi:MAG: hypothetical protein KBD29_01230 [Candidatus Magasanikbacteria bacterium]|nr:hypothetical protein [Candidatus Magasanikbacteria bacterium]
MHLADYIKKPRIQHCLVGVALLILGFVLYYQTFTVGFLSDDWHAVSVVKDTNNIFQFFVTNIVGTTVGSSYGPFWNLALFVQYQLFHLQSVGYHVISILTMVTTALALYGFTRRLTRSFIIACGAGLLFLFVPSHVESVAWISGQPHLIATALYVAALYCYSVFSSQKKVMYYVSACALALGSLLTKEIGISVIAIFFLIDVWFGTISSKKTELKKTLVHVLKYYLPLMVIFVLYMVMRRYTTGVVLGYYGSQSLIFSLQEMIEMAIRMTVGLFLSYPLRESVVLEIMSHIRIVAACIIVAYAGILWVCRKQVYSVVLITLCYVASLVPYLTLHFNALSNEGERYTYVPSLFASLGIAYCLYVILNRFRGGRIIYGVVIVLIIVACIFPIQKKNNEWVQAGRIVRETLPTIEKLDLDLSKPIILVGLPDRIEGAQLFRNGTLLALELLGHGKFTGDRVLMAPLLSDSYSEETAVIDMRTCEDDVEALCVFSGEGKDHQFTGLPSVEMFDVKFTLEDFRKTDHTGEYIRIEGAIESANVVYFNHNAFQLFAK